MTLDEAVDILNDREHRKCAWWNSYKERQTGEWFVKDDPRKYADTYYTEFDAIAIAEKYLRESEQMKPPSEPTPLILGGHRGSMSIAAVSGERA